MRTRLDIELVARGITPSREKAQRLILAGQVRVNNQTAAKPSDKVAPTDRIERVAPERYVSRGGHKLESALDHFQINCHGLVCADLGASTGGFTDCLLQRGASRVHAVDVGRGQLDYSLRQDQRVVVHDDLNARQLTPAQLGETVDLIVMDLSFISLTKVLPATIALLRPGGRIVALIKPQFEAGRQHVKKGGVVRDPAIHQQVIESVSRFVTDQLGLRVLGVIESPLLGPAGNKEFLIGCQS